MSISNCNRAAGKQPRAVLMKIVRRLRRRLTRMAHAAFPLNGAPSIVRGFIGERLAALGVETVEFASSETANARKLGLGRIDAWATMEHVALAPENLACLPRGFALKPLDAHPFTMWLVASLDMRITPRAG